MSFDEILFEKKEGVAVITLNRPERFNAFTTRMYREFPKIIDNIRRDDEIRVMIITGSGKGFCAGSDVTDRLADRLEKGKEENRFETLKQVGAIALDLVNFDKPIITAINGVAVGAGLSIPLISDIRIASENVFAPVGINICSWMEFS